MKKALFFAICCLCALLSACQQENQSTAGTGKSAADGPKKYIFAINPDYPPMEMVSPQDGAIVGFSPELLKAVAEKGGFQYELKNIEWKAIFAALETGEADAILSSVTITDDRKLKYAFSDSYYQISQRLVIRKADAGAVKNISDLTSKKIGVQIGTTGALLMEKQFPNIERVTYDSPIPGMADLQEKKIDAFMVDEPVALQYTRGNTQTKDLLDLIDLRFSEENYGIVLRKKDVELLQKINQGLKAVKEAGIDAELRKKWLL